MMRSLYLITAKQQATEVWPQRKSTWPKFLGWLGLETPADRKDCGNFVLGEFRDERRRQNTVVSRSGVAIDADNASRSFVADSGAELLGCALAFYTTWRHTPEKPRWRLLAPLSRDVTPGEYRLIVGALMIALGFEQFDKGSVEPERLMHKPSEQGHYAHHVIGGEALDADAWLARAKELGIENEPKHEPYVYDGPVRGDGLGLHPYAETAIVEEVARLEGCEILGWVGPHWDDTTFAVACNLIEFANSTWSGYSLRQAYDDLMGNAPTDEGFGPKQHAVKWLSALNKVGNGGRPLPANSSASVVRLNVEATADALPWVMEEVGRRHLSGLFRRGRELVHTPRIGEEGYVPPKNEKDNDGPAQVWSVDATELAARVSLAYDVYKPIRAENGFPFTEKPELFPQQVAGMAVKTVDKMSHLRELHGVTHTPVVRRDGTILDTPGYDAVTGLLYLPDGAFTMRKVSDRPTRAEVDEARDLLLDVLYDFPWKATHDKANFLGAWFTPLLRPLVPPPYKFVLIGAPNPGVGKGYLAKTLRATHGGVTKAEFPSEKAEVTKVIMATLDSTTAPVVTFDNISGTLRSSVFDAVLTIKEFNERLLGTSRMVSLRNDRLWVATGNNVKIGGDTGRRLLRITIDTGKPHPERRDPSGFRIPNLPKWMEDHRGDVLWALLTIIRAWVVSVPEMPEQGQTGDDYGLWVEVVRRILGFAEFGETVGTFDYFDPETADEDNEELQEHAGVLAAIHEEFADATWTAAQVVDALDVDDLPYTVAKAVMSMSGPGSPSKTLGRWLAARDGTWASGMAARGTKTVDGKNTKLWKIDVAIL